MMTDLDDAVAQAKSCPEYLGSFLHNFVNGPQLRMILRETIKKIVASPSQANLLTVGSDFLLLVAANNYTLHLRVVEGKSPLLFTSGADAFIAVPSHSQIDLDVYEVDRSVDLKSFDDQAGLSLRESTPCAGTIVRQEKGKPVVHDFHAQAPSVLAKLTLLPPDELVWVFRRDTMKASHPMLSRADMSALVMLCKMVASMREKRAAYLVADLAQHPSHAVRWAAIQALGQLDPPLAISHLQTALRDEHPNIRASARRTLERLGL